MKSGYPIVEAIIATIRSVIPIERKEVPIHEPSFLGREWEYVKTCLDTGWVSSAGKYVDQFAAKLAEYTGAKYAVPVVNGTSALHICLKLVGVQEGDEVLQPSLTFVATANASAYCGATPHFVDCDEKTLGIDSTKLSTYLHDIAEVRHGACYNKISGARIRAIVPMHTYGHPVDMDPLVEVSHRFKIEIVEDAAESVGSFYKGRHTGNFGKVSALSFNGNKIMTTGGGGAILTNDDLLGRQAKHLTTTAKMEHPWAFFHDQVGFNYRLPNINAALGCAQLEQLPQFLKQKRRLAERYKMALAEIKGINFFTEAEFAQSNYWLNTLILDNSMAHLRDVILQQSNKAGLMTRPTWTPMHRLPMYANCPRMSLETTESLEQRLINIPSSANLIKEES